MVSVQAPESNALRGNTIEGTAVILLRFANGVLGIANVPDVIVSPWSWGFISGENPAYTHTGETCPSPTGASGPAWASTRCPPCGPDGTLIYLLGPDESFWQDDFHLLPAEAETAGLDAIDHLALTLPAGRMDTYVLFWRSLFGLEPQPVWDLPIPTA